MNALDEDMPAVAQELISDFGAMVPWLKKATTGAVDPIGGTRLKQPDAAQALATPPMAQEVLVNNIKQLSTVSYTTDAVNDGDELTFPAGKYRVVSATRIFSGQIECARQLVLKA